MTRKYVNGRIIAFAVVEHSLLSTGTKYPSHLIEPGTLQVEIQRRRCPTKFNRGLLLSLRHSSRRIRWSGRQCCRLPAVSPSCQTSYEAAHVDPRLQQLGEHGSDLRSRRHEGATSFILAEPMMMPSPPCFLPARMKKKHTYVVLEQPRLR